MTTIGPTVGALVIYIEQGKARAAIITEVHEHGIEGISEGPVVDLCVLHRGVQFFDAVRYGGRDGNWHWR